MPTSLQLYYDLLIGLFRAQDIPEFRIMSMFYNRQKINKTNSDILHKQYNNLG